MTMPRVRIEEDELKRVLCQRLNLDQPRFRLERTPRGWLVGSVISASFREQDDVQRQRRIWKALKLEFGERADQVVGVLLAYTPEEWDADPETEGD